MEDNSLSKLLAIAESKNTEPINRDIKQMNDLPDELQQQVLTFVLSLQHEHLQESRNAWDVLELLIGTVEAPADWSAEHDHYLYGTPKHQATE